jgi:hypothetical protein
MMIDLGRSPSGRATRASTEPQEGLGHTASVPNAALTPSAARKVLRNKAGHSAECRRDTTGIWDRSGNCERCSAFAALNDASMS